MGTLRAVWRFTDRHDGDLAVDGGVGLEQRRQAVAAGAWSWLRQVHGSEVAVVTAPGGHAGVAADAAVTDRAGPVLAVQVADCVPIVLVGSGRRTGCARRATGPSGSCTPAGGGWPPGWSPPPWTRCTAWGPPPSPATSVPHIRQRCYEFGAADLDAVTGAVGPEVRGVTAWGTPALDLTAAVRRALDDAGVAVVDDVGTCTACSPVHYSHRAGGDTGRQAAVAWLVEG